jgi:DNA-binding transcriptional LysR family regulator
MTDPDVVSLNEIELRHLRYFLAVAEELHFGRAAEKLHMAQPPLSQQIRQLEAWVGFPLFARNSRSVQLTPSGKELHKRLQHTLVKLENDIRSVREVGRGRRGALDVGFISTSILTSIPQLLSRYRQRYPEVQLRLHELYTSNLVQGLQDGSIDIGFLRDGGPVPGLCTIRVLSEPFVAMLPAQHPLARRKSIPVSLLKKEPFVFFPQSAGLTAWQRTIAICEEHGFRPDIVQEAPHWITITRLVAAGIGVTIAPRCVCQIATSGVVAVELKGVEARSYIELAFDEKSTCAVIAGFLRLARAAFPGEAFQIAQCTPPLRAALQQADAETPKLRQLSSRTGAAQQPAPHPSGATPAAVLR